MQYNLETVEATTLPDAWFQIRCINVLKKERRKTNENYNSILGLGSKTY